MHRELPPSHCKTLERHRKYLEKMIHETKRHLGIHTEGEVMHLRDRHELRDTEHGIREKRKYTKGDAMAFLRCFECNGKKKIAPLGFMQKECPKGKLVILNII